MLVTLALLCLCLSLEEAISTVLQLSIDSWCWHRFMWFNMTSKILTSVNCKNSDFFPWPRHVGVTRSIKHWFWFLFWWTLPVSAKEWKAYTNLQDQNIWKASLPHLKSIEITGVIPTGKQIHLRHSCYLTKLPYCLLCLISICWNPWSIWVFLSASTLFIITSCDLSFQNVLPNFPADSKWFLVFSTPLFP